MLDANLYEEELHPTPLGATWREFKQRMLLCLAW